MTVLRLGLFGGSFDPIHAGHVQTVAAARRQLGLERVVFLPTARPPHKPDRSLAPAFRRYAMVELALVHEEGLEASSLELLLERPAYTVETLETFRQQWPDADLYLIIGADSFADLHLWVRWSEILDLARLAVLARPGVQNDWDERRTPAAAEAIRRRRVDFVANQPIAVSSTELRSSFARGERPAPGLVPELVLDFIGKYRLYQ